jgi:molybdopterin/thiamine biosynthesis adenylyltransferase
MNNESIDTQAPQTNNARVDFWRQLALFPEKNMDIVVHIIGVGAIGSWVALECAKLGIKNIHLWDYDKIEPHNVPNQAYGLESVGKYKVEAIAQTIRDQMGNTNKVTIHNVDIEKECSRKDLSGVVFSCVDSMKLRKHLWENNVKMNPSILLWNETRMGIEQGMVYAVDPTNSAHAKEYENTLYSDESTQEPACNARAIINTSVLTASIAVTQMVNYFAGFKVKQYSIINTRNTEVTSYEW